MESKEIIAKSEIFLKMIEEDCIYLCRSLDFRTICTLLKISPEDLDRRLSCTLGFTGEELLSYMRKSYADYLSKKYGFCIDIAQ